MMAQDSELQHDYVYDIAHRAQKKAIRARQRKLKHDAVGTRHASPASLTWPDIACPSPHASARQRRGMRGEDKAAQYLQNQGLRVLARNIHCRTGEIDLIVTDQTSLIFVEVRLRGSDQYGGAAASVDKAKQRRLIRTAQFFLPQLCTRFFAGRLPPCRFDVICIDNTQLHWIKHAFES